MAAGACLTAGCLLTTSLDGLEGSPLSDGGATDGRFLDDDARDGTIDGPIADGAGAGGPFVVTRVGGTLRGLTARGGDLFWVQTETSPGIARVATQGGDPVFVHNTAQAFDVAADDTYVYWSTGAGSGAGNEVWRKALTAGGAPELLFSGAGETLYIAQGRDGRIYATGSGTIVVGPRADAGTSDALYLSQTGAAGIAVSEGDIFWSSAAGIARGAFGATAPAAPMYRGSPGEVLGVATDGRDVYWIDVRGAVRALSSSDPSGAPPREICRAAGLSDGGSTVEGGEPWKVADVAVDAEWVYFTDPANRTIDKCRKP